MKHGLTGTPTIFSIDPYVSDSTQMHPLGAVGQAENGDKYRYTFLDADVSAGYLLVAPAKIANHVNAALSAAAAIGDDLVIPTLGATAIVANTYDEGWLIFNDVSPEGEYYKITHHEANAGGLATDVWIERGLYTAATTSSEVSLIKNPWNLPVVSQLIAERAAGVTVQDWDVSEKPYGWLKTKGMAALLADSTGWTKGYRLAISNETNGAGGVSDAGATMVDIGQGIDTGTSGEFNAVWLSID